MEPAVIVTIVLVLAFAFAIGANDETVATCAGTGGIKLKHAVAIASILSFTGALFLSPNVAQSIGTGLINGDAIDLGRYLPAIMIAVLLAVAAWLVTAARVGAPVSTTQSIVGAIVGIALCAPLLGTDVVSAIKWTGLGRVVLGWLLSPALGFVVAVVISLAMKHLVRRKIKGLRGFERVEKWFMIALLCLVLVNQLNRAGNDAGNALGIFYGLFEGGNVDAGTLSWLLVAGAAMSGLGLITIGRVLVRKVGKGLVEIRPTDAFCIETSVLVVLSIANVLGLPISGGHVLVLAIIGNAAIKHERVNQATIKRFVVSWIITFPVAALASAGTLALVLLAWTP